MIVEGIVFRVVTDSHPGDPSLEKFGCPRTEYLADSSSDALRWTCDQELAERFPTHHAAEKFAHAQRWHAMVVSAPESAIPESRRPIVQDLPPPLPTIRNRGRKKKKKPAALATSRREHWVIETYG